MAFGVSYIESTDPFQGRLNHTMSISSQPPGENQLM